MAVMETGELLSICFMAFAVGMDAFSVSLGLGMQEMRLKKIAFIGMVIGVAHVIMPLAGILSGVFISFQLGHLTTLASGLLLIGIGMHMLLSAFNRQNKSMLSVQGIGLLVFAASVSMDSFPVGISLGMSGVRAVIALGMFGFISAVLTWTGLIAGKKVHGFLGAYSEILGGSILCAFGLQFVFG